MPAARPSPTSRRFRCRIAGIDACCRPTASTNGSAAPARSGAADAARKQPLHIGMADGSLFGLAGLYERWRSEDGNVLDTCTIVTTAANALLAPIHDRMPLIVAREHYARWLDPANADVGDLIVPFPPAADGATTRCRHGSTTSATTTQRCSTGSSPAADEWQPSTSRHRLRRSRNRCSDSGTSSTRAAGLAAVSCPR